MPQRQEWFRTTLWLPALLAVAGICLAQSPPKTKKQEPAQIHVVSRLVNVSVVVRDKHGHPVTGLSQKNFTIYDGGHKQAIAFFRPPSTGPATSLPSATQPDVYSNARQAAIASGGVTIILLDGLNTGLLEQAYARAQVIRFLKQIQPGDRVALYALGMKLSIIHDFTSSAATLIAAVNRYEISLASTGNKGTQLQMVGKAVEAEAAELNAAKNQYESSFASTGNKDLQKEGKAKAVAAEAGQINAAIEEANQISQAFAANNRLGITIAALRAIALHVAGVPGRKNLIWIAGNLPYCLCHRDKNINPDFYYKNVLGTEQLLSSVNVAVYPVDARGLYGPSLGLVASGGGGGPARWPMRHPTYPPHFAMEDAAKQTGGLAFFNTNDIMGAIRRAVSDADSSYLLSYYPNHKNWKGEFRKIKVKVDQRGLKVRARSGYYATPDLYGQFRDATGIRFAVRVVPRESKGSREVELILKFDPHGIQFEQEKEGEIAKLEYSFFQIDAKGSILGVQQQSSKVIVSQAAYEKGLQEGMGFSVLIPLKEHAATLVVLLRDTRTGVAGSVRIPVDKYQADAKAHE